MPNVSWSDSPPLISSDRGRFPHLKRLLWTLHWGGSQFLHGPRPRALASAKVMAYLLCAKC